MINKTAELFKASKIAALYLRGYSIDSYLANNKLIGVHGYRQNTWSYQFDGLGNGWLTKKAADCENQYNFNVGITIDDSINGAGDTNMEDKGLLEDGHVEDIGPNEEDGLLIDGLNEDKGMLIDGLLENKGLLKDGLLVDSCILNTEGKKPIELIDPKNIDMTVLAKYIIEEPAFIESVVVLIKSYSHNPLNYNGLMTLKQVAEYMQVSENTVESLINQGKLTSHLVGKQHRFYKDDIDLAIRLGKIQVV